MPTLARAGGTEYACELLSDGVVFARAVPGSTALANSGIVDLGGSSIVFDTGLTLQAARALHAAAVAALGRPPALAFNSHWHLDHLVGNQLFAEGPIYATQGTLEQVVDRRAELEGELSADSLRRELTGYESELRSARTPEARANFSEVTGIHRALLGELLTLRLTPPTDGFDREFALPGTRRARLLSFGAGHTASDGLLFLPRERILFAGDLIVNHRHPNLTSGDPEHWLVVLDEIDRLAPSQIVPGHGRLADRVTVGEIREYLRWLIAVAAEPGAPHVPAPFRDWQDPEQLSRNLRFLRERGAASRAPAEAPAGGGDPREGVGARPVRRPTRR